ncbi:MAG: LLM class flavin-dependent oxidoreductase [Pseudonocardia sp.]|nr:LLM class flavin-dependent oxidoreductase [Pseudonocardia sp.]
MHLGYLTHVAGPAPATAVYRDALDLAVAAEQRGFASFWVAQHHGSPAQGLLPSPLVLLAAAAGRTATIRLGTAVVAASLEDPRRVAEDAAVVDALATGRLELGIGAGSDPAASAAFGRDHALRHADCRDAVDRLREILGDPGLVPAAAGLRRRMWWASNSAGIDAAAARGMGLISGRPAESPDDPVVAGLARYWTHATAEPRVAASRIVRAGETAAQVADRWRADPALGWATELLVQTQPTRSDLLTQLATMDVVRAATTQLWGAARPLARA